MTESFEETYPRYPFAALVGFGLAFAGLVASTPAKQPPSSTAAPATGARNRRTSERASIFRESVLLAVAAAAAGGRLDDPRLD